MNNFKVIFVTLTTFCALGETFKFWQLTDIHYDQFYVKNGDTKNYCHAAKKGSAGEFGDYSCEANELLLISAIEAMQSKIKVYQNRIECEKEGEKEECLEN